jgi:glucose-6-phosphate 1-dehydrogenase
MPAKLTQIAVRFKRAPVSLFQSNGAPCPPDDVDCEAAPNELLITLQPNEGFDLRFEVKAPGQSNDGTMQLETQQLSFSYQDAFGPMPDAYRTLLRDVITGDQTLFVHADEVEASWKLHTPVLEAPLTPHPYEAGTWGPDAADRLLSDWTSTLRPVRETA